MSAASNVDEVQVSGRVGGHGDDDGVMTVRIERHGTVLGATAGHAGIDLAVYHRGGGAWVKGRLARRSNRGVEGALIDEATHAKYLIDYDPEDVAIHLSTETYRGSALYCGRLRQGNARKACSLVAVALHGRQMVRLHSLIDATTPGQRQKLLAEVENAFAGLRLLEPKARGAIHGER